MLERANSAEGALRPASLLDAFRLRTGALHVEAERSGIISEILHGRASRGGYALLLRNLLPIYVTMEDALERHRGTPTIGRLARPELYRTPAIAADIRILSEGGAELPLLAEAVDYADAVLTASGGLGSRLVAHAYVRYFGDLSGGQIMKRLLMKSLGLPAAVLAFYEFPTIGDIGAYKIAFSEAIERVGDDLDDFEAVVEEAARAFELNIKLSIALQDAVLGGAVRSI
jgi:heme oxygenase (biliverdin-producing, ferredoxin)